MASSSAKATATPIGVLQGQNPLIYSTADPLILFSVQVCCQTLLLRQRPDVVQAFIILVFCRLLHWPLSKIRQPRVIAEVIGTTLRPPVPLVCIPVR